MLDPTEIKWTLYGAVATAALAIGYLLTRPSRSVRFSENHAAFIPISSAGAKLIGDRMGVDWDEVALEQLRRGIEVEQEHWLTVDGNLEKIADIALAHIYGRRGIDPEDRGLKDYYDRLDVMEKQAERGL